MGANVDGCIMRCPRSRPPLGGGVVTNLAAFLKDGERIWVPHQTTTDTQAVPDNPTNPSIKNDQGGINPPSSFTNINTASQLDLEKLPGIGPVTAGKIISHRQANGPFTCIEDIQLMAGIGSATFETIQALITVEIFP